MILVFVEHSVIQSKVCSRVNSSIAGISRSDSVNRARTLR